MSKPDNKAAAEAHPPKTCFVIGPIGSDDSDTRRNADNVYLGLIEPALIASGLGFDVTRADKITKPGSITEQIINSVLDADLVIADLSERNANAFYELGIRHAANKPTIHLIAEGHEIPFDNQDHRAIRFHPLSFTKLQEKVPELSQQIKNCMVSSYKVSNPVTLALGTKKLNLSADPRDKVIAEISDQLAALTRKVDYIESTPESTRALPKIYGSLVKRLRTEANEVADAEFDGILNPAAHALNFSEEELRRFQKYRQLSLLAKKSEKPQK